MNTNWKLEELRNNCSPLIFEEAKIYIEAIQKKEESISFLNSKLMSSSNIPTGDSAQIKQSKLYIEIALESLAYNLHSLPDVIAHLIIVVMIQPLASNLSNVNVPRNREINAKKVIDTLQRLSSHTSVNDYQKEYIRNTKKYIKNLIDSSEYKYMDALVNTLKHRHLIDIEYHFTKTQNTSDKPKSDWGFSEFEKDGNQYNQVTHKELCESYRSNILDLFHKIGQEINNYCRAEKIKNPNN